MPNDSNADWEVFSLIREVRRRAKRADEKKLFAALGDSDPRLTRSILAAAREMAESSSYGPIGRKRKKRL